MSRVFNFSAGPAMLPEDVLKEVQAELLDWAHQGASVMEVSHRGKAFVACAEKAEADLRYLLNIPDDYHVLFLQGGATMQFSAIPLNLIGRDGKADYAITGSWSKKAVADAKRIANISIAMDSYDNGYRSIPEFGQWKIDSAASYLHITPNETIEGVEFEGLPKVNVPIVADLSSTLLSRPIDVSKYGLIYAGAQKNIGPAGLTIVIVKSSLLGAFSQNEPRMLDYQVMADSNSMSNTPPTFSWYLAGKVFEWLREQGGLDQVGKRNRAKAELLYSAIDDSNGFYENPVDVDCRSLMNVPFILADANLDEAFLKFAAEQGLQTLKGHRSVGGMRASLYNAMPIEGVQALVDCMNSFQSRH